VTPSLTRVEDLDATEVKPNNQREARRQLQILEIFLLKIALQYTEWTQPATTNLLLTQNSRQDALVDGSTRESGQGQGSLRMSKASSAEAIETGEGGESDWVS